MNVQYPNYENWPPHFLSCCLKASGGIYFLSQTRPSFLIGKKIKKCFEYRKSRQAARSCSRAPVGARFPGRLYDWKAHRHPPHMIRTASETDMIIQAIAISLALSIDATSSALSTVRRESKYRWYWCSWSIWSAAASSVCLCWSAAFLKTWYPLADNGDQRHLVFESRQGLYNDPAKITVSIRIL